MDPDIRYLVDDPRFRSPEPVSVIARHEDGTAWVHELRTGRVYACPAEALFPIWALNRRQCLAVASNQLRS